MSDVGKRGRPQVVSDTELLATGEATKAQIAKLFRRDPKTMDRLLYGLVPANKRRGNDVYSIEEAAERLVKPGYSIEAYIRRMHHSDLPPLLGKEFWNGLRARQAYERENGDLWPTAEVKGVCATAFAAIRMALLLMPDEVDREATMSPRQKDVLKRLTDAAIVNIQQTLVETFADYEPPVEALHGAGPGPGHNSGSMGIGGPPPGYDPLLDAPYYEEEGFGLLQPGRDDIRYRASDIDDPGTIDDL